MSDEAGPCVRSTKSVMGDVAQGDVLGRELQLLVERWQIRLGLSDWVITSEYKRHYDMRLNNELTRGMSIIDFQHQEAEVQIIHPMDLKEGDHSVEETVIHELLHMVLFPYSEFLVNFPQFIEEQIIEKLKRALLRGEA